ncbi:MAG: hypothetical protein GFH27_549283n406 [Chloroflexi bacterium AL-W]|nr:hypothetical protein [Chloroflexi bacterium AL-N1]NOK64473.1 hypothetical protein [Chloroflexi bacterium AL-N10]NOK75715.1 hypothetical protein [Chloroflexi bacterium AL-N5]NOK80527.1 hypothetical protein [Chloroflexi bacterium AL-W]NOK87041.1 hypothetical protein [Chloroflexi bacterium AL-N15]
MANGHGGARPGAGRKAKTEKYESEINAAERVITDRLPQIIENMLMLADGGWEKVEEEWKPASMVTIGSGEAEMPAFPDKEPSELVLISRKVTHAAPDRAANQYLIDRILGKPTANVDTTVSGPDGEALIVKFTDSVNKVYGDDDEH